MLHRKRKDCEEKKKTHMRKNEKYRMLMSLYTNYEKKFIYIFIVPEKKNKEKNIRCVILILTCDYCYDDLMNIFRSNKTPLR